MKKIVILSGSGISAESGISTFRGGNGLWDNCRVEDVCTPEGWARNPQYVLDFYNQRRAQLETVQPNDAHVLLAELEKMRGGNGELLYEVVVLTQNVDNLHERAGSSKVIHLHGELTKVRPVNTYTDSDGFSERYVEDIGYRMVHIGDLGKNGKQLRPHIVWFGEAVPKLEQAAHEMSDADIVLIVGTSLQVYPAAGLYRYAPSNANFFIVDPSDDLPLYGSSRFTHYRSVATVGVRQFIDALQNQE